MMRDEFSILGLAEVAIFAAVREIADASGQASRAHVPALVFTENDTRLFWLHQPARDSTGCVSRGRISLRGIPGHESRGP